MPAEEVLREFRTLRESYRRKLPQLLRELAETLRKARQGPQLGEHLGAASRLAHRLKGTSGSYRFDEISAELERIEQLLERILAGAAADLAEDWCEIERLLARLRAQLAATGTGREKGGSGACNGGTAGSY